MKTVCIIQARTGSTRLPGKVMMNILDKPVLWWDMYRIGKCQLIDEIVLATTTNVEDDAIAALAEAEGWSLYRGDENDLLDRYYQAAKEFSADVVVRITSDCPVIDPEVTDNVIRDFFALYPNVDYASNIYERTYPHGMDTEVFTFEALERAWLEDDNPAWREHVVPYIEKNRDKFRLIDVTQNMDQSEIRLTLDEEDDFTLIEKIYNHFSHGDFSMQDIVDLLDENPSWLEINNHVQQKTL